MMVPAFTCAQPLVSDLVLSNLPFVVSINKPLNAVTACFSSLIPFSEPRIESSELKFHSFLIFSNTATILTFPFGITNLLSVIVTFPARTFQALKM